MPRTTRSVLMALPFLAASLCAVPAEADTTRVAVSGTRFVAASGAEFVARGVNFTKVADQVRHVTFTPGVYDASNASAQLAAMASAKYNLVRVFVDPHEIRGKTSTVKLDAAYVANLAGFVNLAKQRGIMVTLAMPGAPWTYTTGAPVHSPAACNGSMNQLAMIGSLVAQKRAYMVDVIKALRTSGAALDNVFSYGIENEFAYDKRCEPINVTPAFDPPSCGASPSPIWKTTNTGRFDMNSKCQWQQAQDSNLVEYIRQVTAGIKGAHPQALVTMGFFSPVIAEAHIAVRPYHAIHSSALDYVGLHFNASPAGVNRPASLDWRSTWTNASLTAQIDAMTERADSPKLLLMEELYLPKPKVTDVGVAAYMARDAQMQVCNRPAGSRMKNSIFWTWNTTDADPGGTYWNLVESGGAINGQVAPVARANPCTL